MGFPGPLKVACVLLAFAVSQAAGQSTLGSITGMVKDPSGAAVAGAAITLRNLDENTVSSAISSRDGLYQFLNLKPGRYTVTSEKPGFASSVTPEILLDARQTQQADLTLALSGRSDTVTVAGQVPLVDTEDGIISDSKNFEQITRLPLNSRAAQSLTSPNGPLSAITTVPGLKENGGGGRLSLSGGLPAQVEISIDGVSVVNISANLPDFGMTTSAEIIGEFKVTSVDNSAEFGQMGDISMVTRGGTNQWHGSAFWYLQNSALNAKPYGSTLPKPAAKFNTFGGSLGGPVSFPGLYHGRNRTFFFLDYEGNRDPASQLDELKVPSAAMRTGNLNGAPGGTALDPLSGLPFPNNQIPLARISSVATNLFNYYPLPNVPANGVYDYQHLTSTPINTDGYDARLDQVLSSRQKLYTRFTGKSTSVVGDNLLLPAGTANFSYYNFVFSHAYSPRAALSNEFRFGFTHTSDLESFPIPGRQAVASLGLTGLNLTNVGNSGGFPFFFLTDFSFMSIGHGRPADKNSRNFQYADSLSWIRGRHSLKIGGEFRHAGYRKTLQTLSAGDDFGEFDFSPRAFSGNSFADLLLGLPATSYYEELGPNIDETENHAAFFVQDSWKVHPRLTLQLGLRWEVHPPFQEAQGNIANFDHQTGNVIIPDHSLPPAPSFLVAINACSPAQGQPCTSVLRASQAGWGQGLRHTYYGDWNPRVGFAWQPVSEGKTVIRGGIGKYTQSLLGFFAYGPTGIATSDVRTYNNYSGPGIPPLFMFPNVSPPLSNVPGAIGSETFASGVDPNFRDPASFQWNFTLERQLPWSTVLRASYIGVESAGMPASVDYNQVAAGKTPYAQAPKPFPVWAGLVSLEPLGFSNYQGLHLEATHRFHDDLFFQASYVLAKSVGNIGSVNINLPTESSPAITNRFDTRYDRGNLGGIRRNTFLLTGLFPLPFGRGRKFGSNWRGLTQSALGGWEISTVTLIESGPYQTPISSLDQSNTNLNSNAIRPDRIGNGNLPNPTPQRYYDISAFADVPTGAGRYGNAGAGILEGPGAVAIAAGLAKTFRLTAELRLRLEATFTNLPNHPNFAPPQVNIDQPGSFGVLTTVQTYQNSGNRSGQVAARFDF
jgi:hypothetical protein